MTAQKILLCTERVFNGLNRGEQKPIVSVVALQHLLIDLGGSTTLDFPKFEIHVAEAQLREKLNGQLWNSFLAGHNDQVHELTGKGWDLIVIVEIRDNVLYPVATCSA